MKVKQLIEKLEEMPEDYEIEIYDSSEDYNLDIQSILRLEPERIVCIEVD